jgi:hypothetical protein
MPSAGWNYGNLKLTIAAGEKAKQDAIIIRDNNFNRIEIGIDDLNNLILDLRKLKNEWYFGAVNETPYVYEHVSIKKYNPNYGDDRVCKCGHSYYRHFDSYDQMEPIGCKYCSCRTFVEKVSDEDAK